MRVCTDTYLITVKDLKVSKVIEIKTTVWTNRKKESFGIQSLLKFTSGTKSKGLCFSLLPKEKSLTKSYKKTSLRESFTTPNQQKPPQGLTTKCSRARVGEGGTCSKRKDLILVRRDHSEFSF